MTDQFTVTVKIQFAHDAQNQIFRVGLAIVQIQFFMHRRRIPTLEALEHV